MDNNERLSQTFDSKVGQVVNGNVININMAPNRPDPEVLRLVGELLNLAKANNVLDSAQRISKIQYGSTHFKSLNVAQLKKLILITQELVELITIKPSVSSPWWKFW